jgi:pimeloyl-ACP methyl ester carboxylesterase
MVQPEQTIRFCTSADGVRIAYATIGSGPPLVKVANWLSHLEFDWNSPVWRHWLTELSRSHTLIRYDERGCGLSDWSMEDVSLDAWVRDLEAVVDALGLERFPLLGLSQGGPIAITYAIRHPERVSHLILAGSYARGRLHRGLSGRELEEQKLMIQLAKVGWGTDHPAFRQVFTMMFIPGGSEEHIRWFNELQRISSTPENASRILDAFDHIDVRQAAAQVTAPTLVMHTTGDLRVPFAEGRLLASLIPRSRFVSLDSPNHIVLETEPAWPRLIRAVREFLGVSRPYSLPEPTRRRSIEELFDRVIDLPPAEREAVLSDAGRADPELRREVEELLAGSDEAGVTAQLGRLVAKAVDVARENTPAQTGEVLSSYEVLEKLGSGGMGVVYRARDLRLQRVVALKFLPSNVGGDRDLIQRFMQEAKAAATLDHPNVCTIHGVEQSADGRIFIVMPYYEGTTVRARIARGPLPMAEALDYARQTAAGLAHAHAAGIVHRDIKPANLAVTVHGMVKILDFGIAKMADTKLTRTGLVLGTLAYMSPEQAAGEPLDHRTDLWSLGVVLYEMLAGVPPFSGATAGLFHAIQFGEPPSLATHRPELPEEVVALVHRLLEKQPDRRCPDAHTVAAALGAVQGTAPARPH